MSSAAARVIDRLAPRLGTAIRARRLTEVRNVVNFMPRGDMTAVDAGANVGLYSYWMAKRASVVHAFEPQPSVFDRLRAGSGPKVRTYNNALSDVAGTATLQVPTQSHGMASLRQIDDMPTTQIDVPLVVLDDLGLDGVGFVKIDVEGHEEQLLRGAAKTLRAGLPVIYIEVEERHNPGGLDRITQFLGDLGYDQHFWDQTGDLRPMDTWDPARYQDPASLESGDPYACNFLFQSSAGPRAGV
ncbi:FkbM family methyltransferase [Nocardioides plantarum]|nr:FkbM family methyltransferase [Nocardioides plantarum]